MLVCVCLFCKRANFFSSLIFCFSAFTKANCCLRIIDFKESNCLLVYFAICIGVSSTPLIIILFFCCSNSFFASSAFCNFVFSSSFVLEALSLEDPAAAVSFAPFAPCFLSSDGAASITSKGLFLLIKFLTELGNLAFASVLTGCESIRIHLDLL